MDKCLGCSPVMLRRDVPTRLGVSRRKVDDLLADQTLVRIDRYLVVGGCHVEATSTSREAAHLLRLDALLTTYPECVATHESAALLHQLPLLELPPYAIATRAWGAWRGGRKGRVRIAPLPPHHVTDVNGRAATTTPRTVADLLRSSSMRNAVVVGDAALRAHCSRPQLINMLDECADWADVGRAVRVLDFCDGRAESPLESVSRVIMHERDVPPPELQVDIATAAGTYRVDFYWKNSRTIGEADGKVKYAGDLFPGKSPAEVVWLEKQREDALRDAGYQVVRWTYEQMLRATDATIGRLLRRLAP